MRVPARAVERLTVSGVIGPSTLTRDLACLRFSAGCGLVCHPRCESLGAPTVRVPLEALPELDRVRHWRPRWQNERAGPPIRSQLSLQEIYGRTLVE